MLAENFPEVEIGDRRGCFTFIEPAKPSKVCTERLRVECLCGRSLLIAQSRFMATTGVGCGCNRPGPRLLRAEVPEAVTDTAADRRRVAWLESRPSKRARGLAYLRKLAQRKAARS